MALLTLLWLGYRVLISVPHEHKWPAHAGVICAAAMFLGPAMTLLAGRRVAREVSSTN